MDFTSSTSTEALPLTQQRSCSCGLTSHLRLGHIDRSAVCSSPTVAFTFRGKTRDVGIFRCSKAEEICQSSRHPGPRLQPNNLLKHGHGWTPNLVGSMPSSSAMIVRDESLTHKIIFWFWFLDPREGVSVGCIDFSLMPESRIAETAPRVKGKGKKRGRGGLR